MDAIERAAVWSGWTLRDGQKEALSSFAAWLRIEGIRGGGLGPNETERVEDRHLADSLLFAVGWPPPDPPARVLDLGSGVGLPGVPLGILWPGSQVTLVERGGRRATLARRGIRALGLENVVVLEGDAATVSARAELVVARASAHPALVGEWAMRLVTAEGVVVIGGSHRSPPRAEAGEEIVVVPPEVLDHPVWLRMMVPA